MAEAAKPLQEAEIVVWHGMIVTAATIKVAAAAIFVTWVAISLTWATIFVTWATTFVTWVTIFVTWVTISITAAATIQKIFSLKPCKNCTAGFSNVTVIAGTKSE